MYIHTRVMTPSPMLQYISRITTRIPSCRVSAFKLQVHEALYYQILYH